MILLNIMANVARPVLRQTKLSFSPVAPPADAARCDTTPVSTRRTSKSSPLLSLTHDDKPAKQVDIESTPARPAPLARTSSRKRPAAELEPDALDARPPTKITVTQHGELHRITNGVAAPLHSTLDDVPSRGSTPRPRSAGKLAAPATTSVSQDKRSLRSHDGGSRVKSDLSAYFANYDDIIAGLPKPSGMVVACEWEALLLTFKQSLSKLIHPSTSSTSPPGRDRPPPTPPDRLLVALLVPRDHGKHNHSHLHAVPRPRYRRRNPPRPTPSSTTAHSQLPLNMSTAKTHPPIHLPTLSTSHSTAAQSARRSS